VKRLISRYSVVGLMAVAAAWAGTAAAAEEKIAVVDFQRLIDESPQGKAASEAMRAEFAPRERTLQAQQQALKAKQDKLQKDGATMTEEQRTRAEKELRDGARDLERARSEFNDDATARRNEELSRLQRALFEEVQTYAKAQSYDLVLSGEGVVYASQPYNITPAILTALQARGPATPAAATPGPGKSAPAAGAATPATAAPAPAKPQSH
jgi:outer membrane protein